MCGIVGTLEFGERPAELQNLRRMVDTISHRGPDGVRVDSRHPIGFGHARLRVIDLSEQADQPMWNEDRSVGIVFNGEIYNFQELRKKLEQQGCSFHTRSDTEVILRLYERLGADAIPQLDGMFALGIWDQRNGLLTLARDRAGKKPLFYYHDSYRFAFASEAKALHAHPAIGREPDLDALPFYLTYGYFPAPSSGYRGIRKLSPATVLSVEVRGAMREHRYWSPPFETNGTSRKQDAVEQLRHLMQQAVVRRLVADVPLGAFLSGGLDSTLVVGLMSRQVQQPIRTFSIGFEGAPDYDETGYAEMAAKAFQTEHTTFKVQPPDQDFLEQLVQHYDGPFGDSSAIPTYIVSKLAREHVTVVLNGDGGDELFAGYQRFVGAVAAERLPMWLKKCGARLASLCPEPPDRTNPLRRIKRFLEVASLPLEKRFQTWCSVFPNAAQDLMLPDPEALDRDVEECFRVPFSEAAEGTTLARLLYLNFCTYLPEDLLVKMDRATMAHGLEARSPFLDTALVEFAGRLPDRFKLHGTTTKYILREAFKDIIPKPILNRSKMGFGVPLGSWFRGPLRPLVADHLTDRESRLFQHVRPEIVTSHLNAHLSGERDFGHRLFSWLTLEMWMRTF